MQDHYFASLQGPGLCCGSSRRMMEAHLQLSGSRMGILSSRREAYHDVCPWVVLKHGLGPGCKSDFRACQDE
jgi:hypothetical protein